MLRVIKVLSIDGGGIRGIIPAIVLAEIEKRTQRPISKLFDLIAGTSTGGILALGLTKPDSLGKPQYSAANMVELYQKECKAIFSRSFWHQLLALDFILREKYPAHGIETVLKRYFGDTRLKEALTEVLITAYDTESRNSWFFKSAKAKGSDPETDFLMRDVARATSAAPTYFSPAQIKTHTMIDYYSLIDGAVFANNPAMCAYVEAISNKPQAKTDILVVSLGTGSFTRPLPYVQIKHWGARWAQPILDVVFDGVSDTVDYQLRQLLHPAKDGSDLYYRFQVQLEQDNDHLDTTNPNHIHLYKLLAEKMIEEKNEDFKRLCEQLTGGTSSRGVAASIANNVQPLRRSKAGNLI